MLFILAITIPLIYSQSLANGTNLPRDAVITFFSASSTIIFLLFFYKKKKLVFSALYFLPLVVFSWAVISLLWSSDIGNSFIKLPQFFSSLLILFLAMQVKIHKHQKLILNGAIITCFFVTLIGLLQLFNFNPFGIHYTTIPASTFINTNHVSIYIEFFIPVLFLFLICNKDSRVKIYYSIALTLSITFLYFLSSFGTLLSMFCAVIFIGLILSKNSYFLPLLKKNYIYLIVILISIVLLIFAIKSTSLQKQQKNPLISITKKSTHQKRLAVYLKSLNAIKDNPVTGFGYGGFRAGILPYIAEVQPISGHNEYKYYQHTHNDYLQQFTETGVISGIIFFSFFTIVLFLGLSSLRNKKFSEKNIFIFAISSGLLVLLFHAFVDFPFHLSASNFLIYLASGFILSSAATKITFKKDIKLLIIAPSLLIILTAFLMLSTYYNIKHIKSSKLIRDSIIALVKEKNCSNAVKLIDRSNQLFEFDFQSQVRQADIYSNCPQPIAKLRPIIQQLVTLNPTNLTARFLQGGIHLHNKNLALAFNDYYYVIEMLPGRALGYIGMGNWALMNNKPKNARIYFEKAISLDPNNKSVKNILEKL